MNNDIKEFFNFEKLRNNFIKRILNLVENKILTSYFKDTFIILIKKEKITNIDLRVVDVIEKLNNIPINFWYEILDKIGAISVISFASDPFIYFKGVENDFQLVKRKGLEINLAKYLTRIELENYENC